MQGQQKYYVIKNYFSGTIHYAISDILHSVATSLSMDDNDDSMWYKRQILVILTHTNWPKILYILEIK